MKSHRGTLTVALVAAAAAFSACSASVSIGDKSISSAKLEDEVATQLHKQNPDLPTPTIDCPNSLKAKVDAVTHCTLSTDTSPDEYDVRVTVTEVKDGNANFDIEVADQPN
jgi:hypothetical protein